MPVPSRGPFAHAARTVAMTIAAMAIAGGCAPVYYPNISHVPLFSAAGELHASASVTTDGYELMGAVSPLEHLGMMGSYAWGKSMADPTIPPDDHRYYELGLCYYTTIAATRSSLARRKPVVPFRAAGWATLMLPVPGGAGR